MPSLGKLIGIVSMGKAFSTLPLLHRLLSGIVTLAILGVITAMMLGALLVGGMYLFYRMLLEHGLEQSAALLMVGGISVLVTLILAAVTAAYARRLMDLPRQIAGHGGIASKFTGIADSFVEGLLTHKVERKD
ncbi:MAG: hypothetical protein JO089_02040 [Alphaproteobacteria bacterium]|nr:hypothetical protein [Alphaproteobacteria bacterium]